MKTNCSKSNIAKTKATDFPWLFFYFVLCYNTNGEYFWGRLFMSEQESRHSQLRHRLKSRISEE